MTQRRCYWILCTVILTFLWSPSALYPSEEADIDIWIQGCVSDASGEPMPFQTICIRDDKDEVLARTTTQPEGSYKAQVPYQRGMTVTIAVENTKSAPIRLPLQSSQNVSGINFSVPYASFVFGKVHNYDGSPIKQAQVGILATGTTARPKYTRLRPDGIFKFYDLPEGTYRIQAAREFCVSKEVAIEVLGTTPEIALTLEKNVGPVTIQFTNFHPARILVGNRMFPSLGNVPGKDGVFTLKECSFGEFSVFSNKKPKGTKEQIQQAELELNQLLAERKAIPANNYQEIKRIEALLGEKSKFVEAMAIPPIDRIVITQEKQNIVMKDE